MCLSVQLATRALRHRTRDRTNLYEDFCICKRVKANRHTRSKDDLGYAIHFGKRTSAENKYEIIFG